MHRELGEEGTSRRRFLKAGVAGLAASAWAEDRVQLPFDIGERPLVKYPQKRPLIRHTARPPQLETPFSVYQESLLTPNDAFLSAITWPVRRLLSRC